MTRTTVHEARHVILGAGGAVGTPLANQLQTQKRRVRLVSRRGVAADGAESVRADLTDAAAVLGAVDEGAVVYLVAGLQYDHRVWREQWPRIMRNVVGACTSKGARLVFLDNVYAYGAVDAPMTEETAVRPSSRKGEVRAEIAGFLQNEMTAGRITASIARAADFYGPFAGKTSVPGILVFPKLSAGKAGQVFADADTKHSYTYTLDIARALPLLADTGDAFGQVWHLPTARPPLTGREFVQLAASALGVPARVSVIPTWAVKAAGLVRPMMRELAEMLYQNDRDYVFDSSKFEGRFQFTPTPYAEGIRATPATIGQP
jgi:nucleoside-diphosphate-sugar epimerase